MTSLHDVPASEVAQVRALARRVAELAASDRMTAIRKRWRDVNELQTLAGHPNRLKDWTRLAIEAAERHRSPDFTNINMPHII